jgi:hypothetical protein
MQSFQIRSSGSPKTRASRSGKVLDRSFKLSETASRFDGTHRLSARTCAASP